MRFDPREIEREPFSETSPSDAIVSPADGDRRRGRGRRRRGSSPDTTSCVERSEQVTLSFIKPLALNLSVVHIRELCPLVGSL
ncbi:hypothetical protein EYF80_062709 [Liparis tanakae]|uniref:Uncharacterized protein n=1 Tax=Liparis tanakae TaxID=230148 RepID=A0A4Z2EE32_9TELE|nr:hypothetical protein EYF80_062709 [Liparis tanakae]